MSKPKNSGGKRAKEVWLIRHQLRNNEPVVYLPNPEVIRNPRRQRYVLVQPLPALREKFLSL